MTTEHDVVAGLAQLLAERCLGALETAAERHGVGEHRFPHENPLFKPEDRLTVTWQERGFLYKRYLPPQPEEEIDRTAALRMLATDRHLLAIEAIRG